MNNDYDYNTSRSYLILPEYGRNIQKMVEHAKTIEDRDERNRAANAIINVMGNMNPHLRDISDFKHKLWDHLAIMADFDLDIDSPYEKPEPSKFQERPNSVPYNNYTIKFKHYGKTIELLVEAAINYEEGSEKELLIKTIANHMKKLYLTWNRENVTDELILSDLKEISKGRLVIDENIKLNEAKDILAKNTKKKKQNPRKK